jgi:ribosome-associated protein
MLEERKGMDILLLDLQPVTILADYFVLCTATSEPHLKALMGDLSRTLMVDVGRPLGVEGQPESGWILLDYGAIVVHLFLAETREFYNLEGLWKEAQTVVHIH